MRGCVKHGPEHDVSGLDRHRAFLGPQQIASVLAWSKVERESQDLSPGRSELEGRGTTMITSDL